MTETTTPALIAVLVVLGLPFLVGILVGWLLRGRRDARRWKTSAATPRQILEVAHTEHPYNKNNDAVLRRAGAKGRAMRAIRHRKHGGFLASAGVPLSDPRPAGATAAGPRFGLASPISVRVYGSVITRE